MLDPPEVTPYDLRCASIKVNCWLKELSGKPQQQQPQHSQFQKPHQQQQPQNSQFQKPHHQQQQQQQQLRDRRLAGSRSGILGSNICLPTQFLVAVDTEAVARCAGGDTDVDSVMSFELESVKQEIAVQKAMVDAHVKLLREAKELHLPRHVKKKRAADYQSGLEKLSQLNLKARTIREQMPYADWLDEDTISQSSSFAYLHGFNGGVGAVSRSGGGDNISVTGSVSSAYHSSSPRNTSSADYCSESLLSGQLYDARSLVSDLSRESSVRSAASANPPSMSSCILGSSQSANQHPNQPHQQQPQPPSIVPRRSNLGPNARAGSKWRRSNSMGNLLADADNEAPAAAANQRHHYQQQQQQYQQQQKQQQQQQRRLPSIPAVTPVNTSFPTPAPSQAPTAYRRGSNASVSSGTSSALSASQQSPYWYTPRSRLEPVPSPPASSAAPLQRRHLKQHSDL